jgi:hypothetical protein
MPGARTSVIEYAISVLAIARSGAWLRRQNRRVGRRFKIGSRRNVMEHARLIGAILKISTATQHHDHSAADLDPIFC